MKSLIFLYYRAINSIMKPDRWPLSKIEEFLDDLEGRLFFPTLDLFSGYWEVPFSDEFKENTNFVCRYGSFSFEFMPFVKMNSPSTFHNMMYVVLSGILFAHVYLEDVVVFSKSLAENLYHLLSIFVFSST